MAASLGDLIQIVDNGLYLGQACNNVWHYRVTSITGLAGDYLNVLTDWFVANVMVQIRQIQVSQFNHTVIEGKNLSNGIDFFQETINLAGTISTGAATLLPSNITSSWKLGRETLTTRNGRKAISGHFDSQVDGNSIVITPANVTAIQNVMASDIIIGLATICEPVIVRRPINPPVGTSYVYSSIGSAILNPIVGTQNSRKQGRGI